MRKKMMAAALAVAALLAAGGSARARAGGGDLGSRPVRLGDVEHLLGQARANAAKTAEGAPAVAGPAQEGDWGPLPQGPTKQILMYEPATAVGGYSSIAYQAESKFRKKCMGVLHGIPDGIHMESFAGCGGDGLCEGTAIGYCLVADDGKPVDYTDVTLLGHAATQGGLGEADYLARMDVMAHCITVLLGAPVGKVIVISAPGRLGDELTHEDVQMTCRVPRIPAVEQLWRRFGPASVIDDRHLPEEYNRIMKEQGLPYRLEE